jgi:hypothetical protein
VTRFLDRRLETQAPEALRAQQWARLQAQARAIHPANAFITR